MFWAFVLLFTTDFCFFFVFELLSWLFYINWLLLRLIYYEILEGDYCLEDLRIWLEWQRCSCMEGMRWFLPEGLRWLRREGLRHLVKRSGLRELDCGESRACILII